MALPIRPCYIDYFMADGTPNRGYVEFTMTSDVVISGVGIIQSQTVRGYLDAKGRVEVGLLATDNPAFTPASWYWMIDEKIENGNVWFCQVPQGDLSPLNLAPYFVPVPPQAVAGVLDHGALSGLGDDDHPQYLTKSEADSYYAPVGGESGGRSRVVSIINSDTVAAMGLYTDYFYKCLNTLKVTLPTAVGNTNSYTVKNWGTGVITIDGVIPQGIDGADTFVILTQYMSITLISDGAGAAAVWMVV